jgi:hypothetical protein
MPQLQFDDIAPKSNALSFDDIAPAAAAPDAAEKPQTQLETGTGSKIDKVSRDLTGVKFEGSPLDVAIGLLTVPGQAAWSAAASTAGIVKGAVGSAFSRVPGMPEYLGEHGDAEQEKRYRELAGKSSGEAFLSEYNRVSENMSKMYVPITPSADKLNRGISEIFSDVFHFVGNDLFERGVPVLPPPFTNIFQIGKGTPIAGTIGETFTAAAALLAGGRKATEVPKKGGGPAEPGVVPPSPQAAWQDFSTRYPETAARFDASAVGKIRLSDFQQGDRTAYDVVNRKLDKELSLSAEQKDILLEGKLRMYLAKVAQQGETPRVGPTGVMEGGAADPAALDKATRATLDGIRQLEDIRMARANRGLPLLEEPAAPAISKEPVVVTKKGVAVTPEQAAASDTALEGMTPEERANALGLSQMGRLRLMMEDANRAEGKAKTAAENKLKQAWAQTFPYRDAARRADGLDRFRNFNGQLTWENLAERMGQPTRDLGLEQPKPEPKVWRKGKGPYVDKFQSGMISIEGLDDLLESAKKLAKSRGLTDWAAIVPPGEDVAFIDTKGRGIGVVDEKGAVIPKGMFEHRDLLNNIRGIEDDSSIRSSSNPGKLGLIRVNIEGKSISFDIIGDPNNDGFVPIPDAIQAIKNYTRELNPGRPVTLHLSDGSYIPLGTTGAIRFGARQKGMIEMEGFDQPKPEDARPLVSAAAARPWSTGTQDQERPMADKVQAAFNKNRIAEEESVKRTLSMNLGRLKRMVFGHDIDLKDALEKSGEYGEEARLRMILQRSATDAAKTEMHEINSRIFDRLSPKERQQVDELARARRIIEIASYKPEYRIPEGITGQEAEAWARQLHRDIGDKAFGKINGAVDDIMNEYRKILLSANKNGVLSDDSLAKLIHFEHSPTQMIDLMDPVIQYNIKGKPISVRSDGVQELGRGKTTPVRMDSQTMLSEALARMRNLEFKNRTLQSLWELADTTPDNGIVQKGKSGAHPPNGWSKLGVRIAGEQKELLMRDDYAEQFVSNPQPMLPWVASAIRVISGSSIMRYMAVGGNPFFVTAGIPMDILHTWMASGREYSAQAPMYAAQMGKDMMETLPDLIKKGPNYQQAMREGLGAQFMTSYGQNVFTRDRTLAEKMMPRHEKISKVLQGFNQDADLWIRLAHRNRLIKNGVPSEDATAMARDRLDYSQGGELIKGIDNMIAFTNVGTQALYKVAKAAQREPADFATKVAWVGGAIAANVLANMITAPETWKSVPTGDKIRGLTLSFGDQLYLIDQDGNKRYFYVPLRLDQVAAPISGTIVGGLEAAEYGKMPSGLITETINQSTNLLGTADLIPIMSALVAMSGWDSFRGKPIYSGPPVKPEDETRWNTSPLSKAVGQATGMSPMRLEAAFGKFVSPNNMWIQLSGGGLRMLLGDSDPRDKAKTSEQFLSEHLRPIVKLTNPVTKYLDGTDDKIMEENSVKKRQHDAVDALVYGMSHGQNDAKAVQAYISTQPPEDREALANRAKSGYHVDQVLQKYEAGDYPGVPPRSWWKITAAAPAKARAQEFYSKWLDADAAARKSMEAIAMSLQQRGAGYRDEAFQRELARERQLLGSEQR